MGGLKKNFRSDTGPQGDTTSVARYHDTMVALMQNRYFLAFAKTQAHQLFLQGFIATDMGYETVKSCCRMV
jgi:hypothetical protein